MGVRLGQPAQVASKERGDSMEQGTVTVFVAGLGSVTTLGALFLGHFLSRSSQREQWMRDRRQEEFQELLGALAASMYAEVEAMYQSELTPEDREEKRRKTADFFRVVQTRIFTFADVIRLDLQREWLAAVNAHLMSRPHDLETFEKTYQTLTQRLVDAATAQRAKKQL
jgi:hypothetical protein